MAANGKAASFTIPAPQIGLEGFSLSPKTVAPNDPVQALVTAVNRGGSPGNYSVTFRVDGAAEDTASGILNPGATKALFFTTRKSQEGSHPVVVDGQGDSFVVVAPVKAKIPTEEKVTAATTTAKDAQGNAVALSGDTVKTETVAGQLQIQLPVQLPTGSNLASFEDKTTGIKVEGNRIEIPVKDEKGEVALKLVATTSTAPAGTGTTAVARVEKLAVETPPKVTDLSRDDPSLGRVSVAVQADLKTLPANASITVTTTKALPPDARSGFELVARGANNTVADVGSAVRVERQNLENVKDVGTVRMRIAVGPDWVAKHGEANVKIYRLADDGTREALPTRLVGTDEQGRMVFEGESTKGFSLFALIALAPLPPAFQVSGLAIAPPVVRPNEPVQISATVSNTGGQPGTFSVIARVAGEPIEAKTVTVPAGRTAAVAFFTKQEKEGTYAVEVETLKGSFQVARPLSPADVGVTNLTIEPREVEAGKPVNITVQVTNRGDLAGKADVTLTINGLIEEVRPINIAAGSTATATFNVTKRVAGPYAVDVNGLKGSFAATRVLRPALFLLGSPQVQPAQVAPGGPVTVRINVSNAGDQRGSREIELLVNGVAEQRKTLALDGLTSQVVTFTVTKDQPGSYAITVDGQSSGFTVVQPALKPAALSLGNLQIAPTQARPGQSITITVDARNTGDLEAQFTVPLLIDASQEATRQVTIKGGEQATVSFTVTRDAIGTYNVSIGNLSGKFAVTEAPPAVSPVVVAGVIALAIGIVGAIVVLFFALRRRRA